MAESGEKFLERLTEYLNKRYEKKLTEEGKKFFFSKAGDEHFIVTSKDAKWSVSTGSGVFPHVEGVDNKIIVWSKFKGNPVDYILFACENDGMHIGYEKAVEIWKMLLDRRNWSKLGRKYKGVIKGLLYAEKAAETATEKTGVKTVFQIFEYPRFLLYYKAMFNTKGMNDDEKLRMVEKALDAVEIACKEW
ncbi:MAG: hypothetical protein QXM98_06675 [Thermoproteota archaeon]